MLQNLWVSIPDQTVGTGWLPPMPDLRDYTESHEEIKVFNQKLKLARVKQKQAASIDLRKWCSPIENQLSLGSCTAHAGIGVVEYFENRAYGKHLEGSRLFLYKTTRNLMHETGDTGAWLRNVMGALVLCGVPDEKYSKCIHERILMIWRKYQMVAGINIFQAENNDFPVKKVIMPESCNSLHKCIAQRKLFNVILSHCTNKF